MSSSDADAAPGPPPAPAAPSTATHTADADTPTANPIVPAGNVAGRALVFVIAIMTFLACLAEGSASLARGAAATWAGEVRSGATIQIAPTDVNDIDRALETARAFALSVAGVQEARIAGADEAAALLEPWLGAGLNLGELPVPRLVEIEIDTADPPNMMAMREGLMLAVPGAVLDDHRTWVDRLVVAARTAVLGGIVLTGLVLAATVLTVVFATRGAMVGNRHIIEVLHFVGADASFVAGQFERHFLRVGATGAAVGFGLALALFAIVSFWPGSAVPSLGWTGWIGMALTATLIAVVTSLTTGMTVRRALDEVDRSRGAGET